MELCIQLLTTRGEGIAREFKLDDNREHMVIGNMVNSLPSLNGKAYFNNTISELQWRDSVGGFEIDCQDVYPAAIFHSNKLSRPTIDECSCGSISSPTLQCFQVLSNTHIVDVDFPKELANTIKARCLGWWGFALLTTGKIDLALTLTLKEETIYPLTYEPKMRTHI